MGREKFIFGQQRRKAKDNKELSYKDLLNDLQLNSWQVELLISGFLFTILATTTTQIREWGEITDLYSEGRQSISSMFATLADFLSMVWIFIIINLSIHILLRSFWVASLGLRYASGEIDYDSLAFSKKFQQFYDKRRITFDRYIERLELWSSLVFAFTLMIIYAVIGLFLYFSISSIVFNFLTNISDYKFIKIALLFARVVYLIFGIIYAADWLLGGRIRRVKWFAPIYYPFYRLISWITLATIFRPLYLNFVDQTRGRNIISGSLVYFLLIFLFLVIVGNIQGYRYIPIDVRENKFLSVSSLNECVYKDQSENCGLERTFSIPSKIITSNYLEFFYQMRGRDNNALATVCPDLESGELLFVESFKEGFYNLQPDPTKASEELKCFNDVLHVSINDSLYTNLDWQFMKGSRQYEFGVMNMFDIAYLERGKHQIKIERGLCNQSPACDSLKWSTYFITFWKEE
ncbi:MAG: hypothetical protein AAF806_09165 [Bacteroidota bacterium]